jgi:hypothetical protein
MVTYRKPIAAGESVTLTLEYLSQNSRQAPEPELALELLLPGKVAGGPPQGMEPGRIVVLPDSSVLLEFPSSPGERYAIQYSIDMEAWVTSPTIVTAVANRTQWVDQGLPRTACHPAVCPSRMYRVVRLEDEKE